MKPRIQLAPDVPDLSVLGAERYEDLMQGCSALVTGSRLQPVEAPEGRSSLRVPLPGTADESGQRRESPRGIGTGWLQVHTWKSGVGALVRERLSQPKSSSPAARRWNLACQLLANGVSAPRPLVLVEEPRALGGTSLLVELELEGFGPLEDWLARDQGEATRRRGLQALGAALGRLFAAGVELPGLDGRGLLVAEPDQDANDEHDCAAQGIDRLRQESALLRERGLRRARLPGIGVTALERGRIVAAPSAQERLERLARLERGLASEGRPIGRERLRLARAALGELPDAAAVLRASSVG